MTSQLPRILDQNGRPMARAFLGGGGYSGSTEHQLNNWSPSLLSADGAILPDLQKITARSQDLSRNNGLMAGAEQSQLDNIIGSGLRIQCMPDYRALGLDPDWAMEWARDTQYKFRNWAESIDFDCDATRRNTLAGLFGLAGRSYLMTGEILAIPQWRKSAAANGYRTAIQMLDPSRLSNPNQTTDTDTLRAGVELNVMGEPVAYHIRNGLQTDARFTGMRNYEWKRVPRNTKWGRRKVLHVFESQRPGQTRGVSTIAAALAKTKMLERFQDVGLEAAIVNAMYAAVIESDYDHAQVIEAMGGPGAEETSQPAADYMGMRANYHGDKGVRMNGVKVPHLFPGERFAFNAAQHPGPNFAEFEKSVLRQLAAARGMSYESLARDYSQTNYSGARAGMLEGWKFIQSRRDFIGSGFGRQIYALWLEEAMDSGRVDMPANAPDFWAAKTAWTGCRWIGPAKGHIDPLKEENADSVAISSGRKTYQDACAERGLDWHDVMDQKAMVLSYAEKLGRPELAAQVNGTAGADETAAQVQAVLDQMADVA